MEEYDRCPVTLTYVYTARNASKAGAVMVVFEEVVF
jgi:hypothetical protein